MNTFIGLTKRNMLVYLKDKATVFFSLLTPLIILFLYLMFLKQNYVSSVTDALSNMKDYITNKQINSFVNSWLVSGLIASSFITVPLSSLNLMVTDREFNRDFDFLSAPIKKWVLGLSYLMASFLNTLLMTFLILTVGLIILKSNGASLGFLDILKCYLALILGSLSGSSFMFLIISFFKKSSTVGAFTGIVCAASGFLIGAYMPISMFANWLQICANTLPGSHIAGLYRNLLMSPQLNDMNKILSSDEFINSMNDDFSLKLNFFNKMIGMNEMLIYSIIITIIIIIIDLFVFIKTSKRR